MNRLETTLNQHPRDPNVCQACGKPESFYGRSESVHDGRTVLRGLLVWEQREDRMTPTGSFVVLCLPCAEAQAAQGALLRRLGTNEPCPGAMQLCGRCEHRQGLRCTHPKLRSNGGPGLELNVPDSREVQWTSKAQEGRPTGSYYMHWPHEPDCDGFPNGHKAPAPEAKK